MRCCGCSKMRAIAFLAVQSVIVVIILDIPALPVISWTNTTHGPERYPDLTSLYPIPKLSAQELPRVMTAYDYKTLMRLLSLTINVLEQYNVSYVLTYGSLIGSYVMHDILPWDDDIDVFIHNSSKAKVMEIFQNDRHYGIQGYHHHKSSGQIYKIFFNTSKHAGKYPWRWPFLDVLSYVEKGNSVQPVEVIYKQSRFDIPKSAFFPFHKRPFGPLWVNAPRDPVVFFRAKYGSFDCKTGIMDHKNEKHIKILSSPCNRLSKFYPFVKREKRGNQTEETLMLNGTTMYKIVVDEPFHASHTVYGW